MMSIDKAAILVTGGAGYIGGQAVLALLDQGFQPVILDDLSRNSGHYIPEGVPFYKGRVHDEKLVCEILRKHQIKDVMHFAAYIRVDESVANPELYYENNVDGTVKLLSACRACDVERFIFSSTAAVYGDVEGRPVTEDMPCYPINPYGISKLRAEEQIKFACADGAMKYGIFRYFNVAGADIKLRHGYRGSEVTHIIGRALMVALGELEKISVFGDDFPTKDGTGVRDYIHVVDLIKAHLQLRAYLEGGGDSNVFNLGYGKGASVMDIIHTLSDVTGKNISYSIDARRAGDPAEVIADASKAKNVLAWQGEHAALDEILKNAYQWACALTNKKLHSSQEEKDL